MTNILMKAEALKTPMILKRADARLGDTAMFDMKGVPGGVEFTIRDGAEVKACMVLDPDRVKYVIRVLCTLSGSKVNEWRT